MVAKGNTHELMRRWEFKGLDEVGGGDRTSGRLETSTGTVTHAGDYETATASMLS